MGSKKTTKTTEGTSQTQPWSPAQPYLTEILGLAQQQASKPATFGPSAYPDFSPNTQAAQNQIVDLANNPTGLIPAAQSGLGQTIAGDYLNAAPANQSLGQILSGERGINPGYFDPSTGFNTGLMTQGYDDPAASYFVGLMNQGYNDPGQSLYGQLANTQSGAGGMYAQLANLTPGQGASNIYSDIAGMQSGVTGLSPTSYQAGQGATDLYGQASGMRAGQGASGIYSDIAGMQSNAAPLYSDIAGQRAREDALPYFQSLTGLQSSNPSTGFYQDVQSGGIPGYSNALGGLNGADTSSLDPFASGDLMGTNPYLNDYMDIIQNRVRDNVGGAFGASNRYGSGAHQQLLARETGDALTQFLTPIYESDMNRRLSAAGQVSQLGEQGRQFDIGAQLQGLNNDFLARMTGADRLTADAARGDQFQANNILAGAQGIMGQQGFGDQFGLSAMSTGAAGMNAADQFNLGAASTGAAGLQDQSQFANQYDLGALLSGAQGIQNQSQFADTLGQQSAQFGDAFRQGNQQFADQFGLSAASTGAQGIQNQDQFINNYLASVLGQGAAGTLASDQFGAGNLATGAAGLSQGAASQTAAQTQGGAMASDIARQNLAAQQSGAQALTGSAQFRAGLNTQAQTDNMRNALAAGSELNSAYGQERANQLNSIINAPALDQARYLDADRLGQVGAQQDQLNAARAAEAQQRHQYETFTAPWNQLINYSNIANQIAGQGSTSDWYQKEVTKKKGDVLSGILGGASLASSFINPLAGAGAAAGSAGGLAGASGAMLGGISPYYASSPLLSTNPYSFGGGGGSNFYNSTMFR